MNAVQFSVVSDNEVFCEEKKNEFREILDEDRNTVKSLLQYFLRDYLFCSILKALKLLAIGLGSPYHPI